jgi:hypothetical protein
MSPRTIRTQIAGLVLRVGRHELYGLMEIAVGSAEHLH